MLTIACVRTGPKYSADYVTRLRDGVARHLNRPHRFVVLTDRPAAETPDGVERIDIAQHPAIQEARSGATGTRQAISLPGWWGKMARFSTARRGAALKSAG